MGVAKETGSVGLGSASDVASVQERQQQQPGRSQWEHGQRQGQWQDQAGARAGACEAGGVANGAARLALVPLSKAETLQGQGHEQRQEQRQEQGQRQEHAQGQRQERAQGQRQGQGSVGTGTHGSAAPQGRRRTTWRFYLTWIRRIVVVKVLTTLLFSSS